ncbi:MAG: EF-hand domain-containing protein [Desulfovibrio sp.]|jgi:Ca2+-binding EF-hand superfamily protein|nr:EF-hand domain-containing protein [Desulfovibrio sp.]
MRSTVFAVSPALLAPAGALLLAALLFAPGHAQVPASQGVPAFHLLDRDGDGRVTLAEVLAYAKQQRELAKPFAVKDVDRDGDGIITQEELKAAGIKGFEGMGSISVKELDKNGDGYVSHEDIENYLNTKHREAYARADADGDGRITPSEFVLFRFK